MDVRVPFLLCFICACLLSRTGNAQGEEVQYVIREIGISGNNVTRERIILRELAFAAGDTLDSTAVEERIQKSRNNLLNTSLFNYVTVEKSLSNNNELAIRINVEERWYTWPMPIFELADRNFNTWWQTKDLSRTNYGFYIVRYNFRGRRETLKLRARFGYSEQYSLSYTIPYLNNGQKSGLSYSLGYSRNHEVNYGSFGNEQLFYKNEERHVRRVFSTDLAYTYRPGIYNTHSARVKYTDNVISDTVALLNPDYFVDRGSSIRYISASYWFRRDMRDFRPYPLKGYCFDVEVVKVGFGLVNKDGLDLLYGLASFKKYWQLGKRNYFSAAFKAKLATQKKQPYSLQQGLGYGSSYVRSYELNVIDGQSYWLAKSAFKYALITPRVKKFAFIPSDKFNKVSYALYLNFFGDAGYVVDDYFAQHNELANSLLIGTGIGFDFVTYYDKVMRVEYSVNRFGEDGIFLHFVAPI